MNHIKIVPTNINSLIEDVENLHTDERGIVTTTIPLIKRMLEAALSQCTLEWEPEWEDGDEPCLECSAKIPFEYALEIWQAPTVRQYDCVLSKSTTGERLRILKRDCVSIEAAKQVAQCWVNEKLNGGESIAGN
jgi:hypothetical protein